MSIPSSVAFGLLCPCCSCCFYGDYKGRTANDIATKIETHIDEHIENIREFSKSTSSEIKVTYENVDFVYFVGTLDENKKIQRYFNRTSAIRRLFTNYSVGDNICQKLSGYIQRKFSFQIEIFYEIVDGHTKFGYTITMKRL